MMGYLDTAHLLATAAYFLPALVWTVIAADLWSGYRTRKARSQLWRLLPFLATAVAGFYAISTGLWLLPVKVFVQRTPGLILLYSVSDVLLLSAVAMFRHASLLFPLREQRPSGAWLAANYALPLLVFLVPNGIPGVDLAARLFIMRIAYLVYITVMLTSSTWQIGRYARRGVWRPGGLGEARYADLFILGAGLLGIALLLLRELSGDQLASPAPWTPFLGGLVGLVLATPFVVRRLAEVLRRCLLALASLALIALTFACVEKLAFTAGEPALRPLFALAAIFLPALVVLAAQAPLRRAIDRIALRRNLQRRTELHSFLLGLGPQAGVGECCGRALGAVVEVMRLRGAAVVLERDGRWLVKGTLDIEPLRRLWVTGTPLPGHSSWAETLRELSDDQQEAFIESDATGTVPIVSPRRRWGHLVFAAHGWGAGFADDDVQSVESFADELALVLDTAELLERAVEVERSLAHSEKLAAIGELSARVAHEIRNPVTAARSLAQQLLREPASPFREEHELILQELERVERQVAALLRFARRDEFDFSAVDLGALVRRTATELSPRAEAAGVVFAVEASPAVFVRGDREKLRQVLVNLCENSIDALHGRAGERRIALSVATNNGHAALSVADSGPGVEPQALPRIFEAFYSGKKQGTGLGLAIVKRIIDAHGGTIHAASGPGMTFDIELPVVEESALHLTQRSGPKEAREA
jgi:signal transduction histidine kinase